MNATYMTVAGWVATRVDRQEYERGTRVSFRVASTERRYNRTSGEWGDAGTIYLTVKCWRQLGENVQKSLRVGDPVIVHGRVVGRSVERDGRRESILEMDADAVGPDLRWSFASVTRARAAAAGAPTGAGAAESRDASLEAHAGVEQGGPSGTAGAAERHPTTVPIPRNGHGAGVGAVEGAVRA
jgi:single-strand DNA-binding protein